MTTAAYTPLKKEFLDSVLPSKQQYYEEFNDHTDRCNRISDDNFGESIGEKLWTNQKTKDYASKTMEAWCYASWKKNSISSHDDEPCRFLYYWIGEKVYANLGKNSWEETMQAIYNELKGPTGKKTCGIIYEHNIDQTIFNAMKIVYEYYRNYHTMKHHLETSHFYCDEECKSYLREIFVAYEAVDAHCNEENSEQYCQDFRSWSNDQEYRDLLKKGCNTETREEHKAIEGHYRVNPGSRAPQEISGPVWDSLPTTESTSSGSIAAVSTILPMTGMALISFFLYKYNLLPSWINDSFRKNKAGGRNRGNGRRKGRSTNDRHFDASTEGSSTIDCSTTIAPSTIASTIGDLSTSTTDAASTIYNGGQHGRLRNKGAQYQRTNERRNNIAYHSM